MIRFLLAKLHNGYQISIENLIAFWPNLKFYDARPPVEHTMFILWMFIFPTRKTDENYDDDLKMYMFTVKIDEITIILQKSYGSEGGEDGKVCYPKKQWVKEALLEFVQLNLAKEIEKGKEFQIFYKYYRDPLEKFIKLRNKAVKGKRQDTVPQQLSLFQDKF